MNPFHFGRKISQSRENSLMCKRNTLQLGRAQQAARERARLLLRGTLEWLLTTSPNGELARTLQKKVCLPDGFDHDVNQQLVWCRFPFFQETISLWSKFSASCELLKYRGNQSYTFTCIWVERMLKKANSTGNYVRCEGALQPGDHNLLLSL